MEKVTLQSVITPLRHRTYTQLRSMLRPGQEFLSRVVEKINEQNFILNIKGLTVRAQSTVPLLAGELVNLKVIKLQPRIVFRRVNRTGERNIVSSELFEQILEDPEIRDFFQTGKLEIDRDNIELIKQIQEYLKQKKLVLTPDEKVQLVSILRRLSLPASGKYIDLISEIINPSVDLGVSLKNLIKHFESGEFQIDKTKIEKLREYLQRLEHKGYLKASELGLQYEKNLNRGVVETSLKRILLELLSLQKIKDSVLSKEIPLLLSRITAFQLLNVSSHSDNILALILPWFFHNQELTPIMVEEERAKQNSGSGVVLRTELETRRYGPVEILMRLRDGKVNLYLNVISREIKERLQQEGEQLKNRLLEAGVNLHAFSVGIIRVPSVVENHETSLNDRLDIFV